MTPVHTGAAIWLPEYHARVYADLYRMGKVVIARCGPVDHTSPRSPNDYDLLIGSGSWFDKNANPSTIVARLHHLSIPDTHKERWS